MEALPARAIRSRERDDTAAPGRDELEGIGWGVGDDVGWPVGQTNVSRDEGMAHRFARVALVGRNRQGGAGSGMGRGIRQLDRIRTGARAGCNHIINTAVKQTLEGGLARLDVIDDPLALLEMLRGDDAAGVRAEINVVRARVVAGDVSVAVVHIDIDAGAAEAGCAVGVIGDSLAVRKAVAGNLDV